MAGILCELKQQIKEATIVIENYNLFQVLSGAIIEGKKSN